ncbi:RICIN domain-containing protein [Streptosporangium sp. V21-05]|uniref:RICIN domain-containing protein n=1 Tax=Streptosporangium sp. V21-05 TaxID=3446115 RepID=UPI003F53CF12
MRKKWLFKVIAAFAVVASGLALTTAPAQASAVAGKRIKMVEFSRCLDVKDFNTGNGALVQLWSCNNNANQLWNFYRDGTIRSVLNGKCLDIKEFNIRAGAVVQMWSCSGAANQRWYWGPKYNNVGYRTIRSVLNGFCLDAKGKQHKLGTPIQTWSCSQQWNQAFRMI